MSKFALAIHGGAGTILRSLMTPELELEYRSGLEEALKTGWDILRNGGTSLDAVEATVCSLEDFPLFNAGRGSVFTHEGKNEMDAAIMSSRTFSAGAVAGSVVAGAALGGATFLGALVLLGQTRAIVPAVALSALLLLVAVPGRTKRAWALAIAGAGVTSVLEEWYARQGNGWAAQGDRGVVGARRPRR